MLLNLVKSIIITGIVLLFNFTVVDTTVQAETMSTLNNLKKLDLKSAVRISLVESPTLESVKERVMQAKHFVAQVRSSYWPTLSANLSYYHVKYAEKIAHPVLDMEDLLGEDLFNNIQSQLPEGRTIPNEIDLGDFFPDDGTFYSADLTANWLLFNGFEREYNYAAAKHGLKVSRHSLADARRLLIGTVVKAYLGALLGEDGISIAKADEEFNLRLLEDTKALQNAGYSSMSDVMGVQISLNYSRTKLLDAQKNYQIALVGLAALLGIPDAHFPKHLSLVPLQEETNEMLSDPDVNKALSYAKSHRPDLLAQKETVELLHSSLGAARGQFYPSFWLSASYNATREDDYNFGGDDFGNQIGIYMTYNFFAGGRDREGLLASKSRLRGSKKKLEETLQTTVVAVQSAAVTVRSAQEQFRLQQETAILVTKNRDLVKKEYLAGKKTMTELREAQKDLTTVQGYLAQSRAALRQAWLDMEKETGKILERFGSE